MLACLTLSAGGMDITWNKATGWIDYIDLDGRPLMQKDASLKPDFWRAPTDNDTVEWLEDYLSNIEQTVLVVSHAPSPE